MLGIDIVDLTDHKQRTRDERALKLILNKSDKVISHPHIYWLLWSAKEAVFKCKREAYNFSPTQIPIQLSESDGIIAFTSDKINGIIKAANSYVLAICAEDLENIRFEVFEKERVSNSSNTRELIISYFKSKNLK